MNEGQAMNLLARYKESLRNIPSPGGGCHPALLSAANFGAMAGIDQQQIHNDLKRMIPRGKRRISDREITDAINKALSDHNDGTFTPKARPEPLVRDGKAALQRIIKQAKITTEVDLWESSPIRLLEAP